MGKGKLFEVLAVEGEAQGRAIKLVAELLSVFKNKENLFRGKSRKLSLFDKSSENTLEVEALEAKDSIATKVETTVPDSLNYLGGILADYWDVMFQKEASNQIAKADIIIEGQVLATGVPVTFLLSMESRLKDLRPVLESIPTLAPSIAWSKDELMGEFIYVSNETTNVKTREDTEYRIVAPATEKHPAQVVPVKGQFNIGKYTDREWSGMISTAEKAKLLEKFDKLARAVKQARQRANDVEAINTKIGDTLAESLLGSWFNRKTMNPTKL